MRRIPVNNYFFYSISPDQHTTMTENKMFYCTGEVVNGKQIFVLKRHSTPNLGKEMTKQVRFEMAERVRSNSEHLESGNVSF